MLVAFASTVLVLLIAILVNEIVAQREETRGPSKSAKRFEAGVPNPLDDPSLGAPRSFDEHVKAKASIAASQRLSAISKAQAAIKAQESHLGASAEQSEMRIEAGAVRRVGGAPQRDRTAMMDTVRPLGQQRPGRYPSGLPDPYADVSRDVTRSPNNGGVRKIGADAVNFGGAQGSPVPVQSAGYASNQPTYREPVIDRDAEFLQMVNQSRRSPAVRNQPMQQPAQQQMIQHEPLVQYSPYDSQQAPVRRERRPARRDPSNAYAGVPVIDSPVIFDAPVLIGRASARLNSIIGEESSYQRPAKREARQPRESVESMRRSSVVMDAPRFEEWSDSVLVERADRAESSRLGSRRASVQIEAHQNELEQIETLEQNSGQEPAQGPAKEEEMARVSSKSSAASRMASVRTSEQSAVEPGMSAEAYDLSRANPGDLAGFSGLLGQVSVDSQRAERMVSVKLPSVSQREEPVAQSPISASDPIETPQQAALKEEEQISPEAPQLEADEPEPESPAQPMLIDSFYAPVNVITSHDSIEERGVEDQRGETMNDYEHDTPSEIEMQQTHEADHAEAHEAESEAPRSTSSAISDTLVAAIAPPSVDCSGRFRPADEDLRAAEESRRLKELARQQAEARAEAQALAAEQAASQRDVFYDEPIHNEYVSSGFSHVIRDYTARGAQQEVAAVDEQREAPSDRIAERVQDRVQERIEDRIYDERQTFHAHAEPEPLAEEQESAQVSDTVMITDTPIRLASGEFVVLDDSSFPQVSDAALYFDDQSSPADHQPEGEESAPARPLRAYVVSGPRAKGALSTRYHSALQEGVEAPASAPISETNDESESTMSGKMLDPKGFPAPKQVPSAHAPKSEARKAKGSIFRSSFPRTQAVELPSARFTPSQLKAQAQSKADAQVKTSHPALHLVDDASIRSPISDIVIHDQQIDTESGRFRKAS